MDMATVAEIVGLLSTVLGATWWLSTRMERMSMNLERHTDILKEQIQQIEHQIDELKLAVAGTRTEVNELRERTVRLETMQEVDCGKRT